MAYDPKLAARVRNLVARRRGVEERAMFGGLAFLLDGKMFCGVSGDELLGRVGPAAHQAALARPHVRVMDFNGKPMRGYVFVGPRALASDAALEGWVGQCAAFAATLPEKKPGKKAARGKAAARRGKAAGARR